MTITAPSYTNLRKVHLEAGGFIGNVADDTIQLAILEASLEADIISFQTSNRTAVFNHARRQYTTCLAANILVHNLGTGLKSKSLADLRVEYDTTSIREAIMRFMECMNKWEPQVMSGGNTQNAKTPALVVKGELDLDRPIVSRGFESASQSSMARRVPAANTRALPKNSRRYVRTWGRTATFKKYW